MASEWSWPEAMHVAAERGDPVLISGYRYIRSDVLGSDTLIPCLRRGGDGCAIDVHEDCTERWDAHHRAQDAPSHDVGPPARDSTEELLAESERIVTRLRSELEGRSVRCGHRRWCRSWADHLRLCGDAATLEDYVRSTAEAAAVDPQAAVDRLREHQRRERS